MGSGLSLEYSKLDCPTFEVLYKSVGLLDTIVTFGDWTRLQHTTWGPANSSLGSMKPVKNNHPSNNGMSRDIILKPYNPMPFHLLLPSYVRLHPILELHYISMSTIQRSSLPILLPDKGKGRVPKL
ncbi:Uncharacterized protein TCM_008600 [Theobroma cacao]|uniref:Uncharacterized protein n=1 Tax=Theobroma cacao TaxID=3641 RepID=A0A061E561_THECC|nr:Uncharacterized protein TCM_008600 [Theobroma cacao]